MDRKIVFTPAWDRSNPDPSKDYGVSDLEIYFVVSENNKFVSFELSTNWYQPHVMERRLEAMKRDVFLGKEDFLLERWIAPYPMDVFYISPERISEDDSHWEDGCHVFGVTEPCYYGYKYEEEAGGLWTTNHVYWMLIELGDDAVWEYLENYYREVFGND